MKKTSYFLMRQNIINLQFINCPLILNIFVKTALIHFQTSPIIYLSEIRCRSKLHTKMKQRFIYELFYVKLNSKTLQNERVETINNIWAVFFWSYVASPCKAKKTFMSTRYNNKCNKYPSLSVAVL